MASIFKGERPIPKLPTTEERIVRISAEIVLAEEILADPDRIAAEVLYREEKLKGLDRPKDSKPLDEIIRIVLNESITRNKDIVAYLQAKQKSQNNYSLEPKK